MKNKKRLKDNHRIEASKTFESKLMVLEDVTEARRRLLKIANEHNNTDYAYIGDGAIVARSRGGKLHRIENTDDPCHLQLQRCVWPRII